MNHTPIPHVNSLPSKLIDGKVAIFVKADAQNYTLDELKKALKSQPDTQNNLKIILKDLEDKSILKKSSRFLRSDYWALLFS